MAGKEVGNRTINKEVAAVSAMLNWGVEEKLIAENPIRKMVKLPEDDPKKERRELTAE